MAFPQRFDNDPPNNLLNEFLFPATGQVLQCLHTEKTVCCKFDAVFVKKGIGEI